MEFQNSKTVNARPCDICGATPIRLKICEKSNIKRTITHANQKQIKSFLEKGSLENKWFVQSPIEAKISTRVPKRRHVCPRPPVAKQITRTKKF